MSEENKDLEGNENEEQNNSWDDDDFGLPDLDYSPLDKDSETESEDEPASDDNPVYEAPEEDSHSAETEDTGSDFNFQSTESEEYSEEDTTPDDYQIDYDDPHTDSEDDEDEEEKPKKSSAGVIITIIVLLVLSGGVLGYLYWFKPMQDQKKYDEFIQLGSSSFDKGMFDEAIGSFNNAKEVKPDEVLPDQLISKAVSARDSVAQALAAKEEQDRLAKEEEERKRKEAEEAAKKLKSGMIDKLSSRTGKYYVVVASNIDEDLAMDFAKKISKQGMNSRIIVAAKKGGYNRVTVGQFDTSSEAQEHANSIQSNFPSAWVVKF